jgi:hypothetical protein
MNQLPALTAATLLTLWEGGVDQPLAQRALQLLSAARPDIAYDTWAQLPLGRRDAELLRLRAELFGPRLVSVVPCPQCGEQLQMTLDAADLPAPAALAPAAAAEAGLQTVTVPPYILRYRLPNSTDLLAVARCESVEAARALLLQRCLQSAERDQAVEPPETLPATVIAALAAHMAQADPQADLQLDVRCPACGHSWPAGFDVTAYLWAEIDRWARRLLRDVHTLASAYGWSETDVLALSAVRRQAYLDLIRE